MEHYYLATRRVWKCKSCSKQFSVKVGTVMEDSPISLTKWLPAIWMITNAKNGCSSWELHRAIGVTQKTAWFMFHRIRLAMQQGSFEKMGGPGGPEVEVDETFIGGKARFMHRDKRPGGTGMTGKEVVMGFLERGGKVRTLHVADRKRRTLEPNVREHVEEGGYVYSDACYSYDQLSKWYQHGVIDHAVEYVEGRVHTNGLENFWSLLKRSIKGTYVSVEPFHLFRYLDEQTFRFNERDGKDADRFATVLGNVSGKRVTYKELTGKTESAGV